MQALWGWRVADRDRSMEEVERTIGKMLMRALRVAVEEGIINCEVASCVEDRPTESLRDSCGQESSDEDQGLGRKGPRRKESYQRARATGSVLLLVCPRRPGSRRQAHTSCIRSTCVSWNLRKGESFPCTELGKGPGARSIRDRSASGSPHPCPMSSENTCPPPALQVLTAHGPRPPSCSWQTGHWCP